MELKNILTGVADRLSSLREERPSAGTKYRLMGMVVDITEATETLSKEVLERVKQEAVLDADVDVDFDVVAEEVLSWELATTKEDLLENTQLVNDALGGLSEVLMQISSQLARRHKDEENAKSHRNAFLKYMHKISLAQEEYKKLQAAPQEIPENALNYFAPSKNLKVLLTEEWFGMLTADEKRFTAKWIHGFVDALMTSEWREQIATDWAVADKRLGLKCMVVGVLKDAGVIRGSYNSIAKLLDMDSENPATLAKYMGMGKKQPFAEWITHYVKG